MNQGKENRDLKRDAMHPVSQLFPHSNTDVDAVFSATGAG